MLEPFVDGAKVCYSQVKWFSPFYFGCGRAHAVTDTRTQAARQAGGVSSTATLCAVPPARDERVLLLKWLENLSKIKMLLSKKQNGVCDHLY